LNDTGYVEHRNVGIEYRWAEGQYDRLPAMAADLVRRQVIVIYASPTAAALAAKAATTTIPIVFSTAGDPVQLGLVVSLNRPGGNLRGATFYTAQRGSKQLELLHELVPKAVVIGVLANPNAPTAEPQIGELQAAANAWNDGRNVQIDTRWGSGNHEEIRKHAAELVALAPDVILASGGSVAEQLIQVTRAVPIVFTQTPDPVGAGFVDSLARPGGNATGFPLFEYGISGKWSELLKEIAPRATRAAVLRDPTLASGGGQLGAIQSVAPSFGVELSPVNVRNSDEIERAITAFAREPNGGLIVTGSSLATAHRDLIIALAARYRLPAVYPQRYYVTGGGLISYGPDTVDPFRRAAVYVDRILKGEKPADLPVQAPVKYETAINLKTTKALGLEVPSSFPGRMYPPYGHSRYMLRQQGSGGTPGCRCYAFLRS
jgi:putative tryptophan/tyrosine transport system substrate-binding protein